MPSGLDRERGATLVIIAFAMTALLIMVSLVLDMSLSRTDRRVNKSTADAAATAGGSAIPDGPWPAVCTALEYLLTNAKGYSSFDTTGWQDGQGNTVSDPCADTTGTTYTTPCTPDLASEDSPVYLPASSRANRTSWAWFTGTAAGGRITVDIKSGYRLPGEETPSWSDDTSNPDPGLNGGCDHVAIIISETRSKGFSGVVAGAGERTTRIRSVARSNNLIIGDDVAALNLLERHECNVLQTGGSNTRVVAFANPPRPGLVQFDSEADSGSCPQPIINGQSTSGGPSIVACSTNSAEPVCGPPDTGPVFLSRIAVWALSRGAPPGDVAPAFSSGTYGDTAAAPSPRQVGRGPADERYLGNVTDLDAAAQDAICATTAANCPATRTIPKGCGPVTGGLCTSGSTTWRVISGNAGCSNPGAAFASATITEANVFFNCNSGGGGPSSKVTIPSTGLTINAANSNVIINGPLEVLGSFTVTDPRTFWVGGTSSGGNPRGVSIGNGGTLTLNRGASADCAARLAANRDLSTTFVVGKGKFEIGGGAATPAATAEMCQTFVFLASNFDRVPITEGTAPCTTADNTAPCDGYNGLMDVGSAGVVKWTAPNELATKPDPADFATHKFEDIAIWTEAAGNSRISGGSTTLMAGIFFFPNANDFSLAGGGTSDINLNAQFWTRQMQVTGGATVFLKPNPDDSISTFEFSTNLVR